MASETKTIVVRLTRDAIIEDVPQGVGTLLAEIELPAGLSLRELTELLHEGNAETQLTTGN